MRHKRNFLPDIKKKKNNNISWLRHLEYQLERRNISPSDSIVRFASHLRAVACKTFEKREKNNCFSLSVMQGRNAGEQIAGTSCAADYKRPWENETPVFRGEVWTFVIQPVMPREIFFCAKNTAWISQGKVERTVKCWKKCREIVQSGSHS